MVFLDDFPFSILEIGQTHSLYEIGESKISFAWTCPPHLVGKTYRLVITAGPKGLSYYLEVNHFTPILVGDLRPPSHLKWAVTFHYYPDDQPENTYDISIDTLIDQIKQGSKNVYLKQHVVTAKNFLEYFHEFCWLN
jgi:hypothetical protein